MKRNEKPNSTICIWRESNIPFLIGNVRAISFPFFQAHRVLRRCYNKSTFLSLKFLRHTVCPKPLCGSANSERVGVHSVSWTMLACTLAPASGARDKRLKRLTGWWRVRGRRKISQSGKAASVQQRSGEKRQVVEGRRVAESSRCGGRERVEFYRVARSHCWRSGKNGRVGRACSPFLPRCCLARFHGAARRGLKKI